MWCVCVCVFALLSPYSESSVFNKKTKHVKQCSSLTEHFDIDDEWTVLHHENTTESQHLDLRTRF